MRHVVRRRDWNIAERAVTLERLYLDRRRFLQGIGLAGSNALAGLPAAAVAIAPDSQTSVGAVTKTSALARYVRYSEFAPWGEEAALLAERLPPEPWRLEVRGEVEHAISIDVDALAALPGQDERVYRMRCVEGWSAAIPWRGIPLHRLLERVRPTAAARYVVFYSFHLPAVAVGQRAADWRIWPYREALTIDEAVHELTLLATGMYGRSLPRAHGGPLRLVVPWKHAYKSVKAVVAIELVRARPATFWGDVRAHEYDFQANVDPRQDHPRWPQHTEIDIGRGAQRRTERYNGYGRWVASLYT